MLAAAGQFEILATASQTNMSETLRPVSAPRVGAEPDWREDFVNENLRRIFLQVYRIVGNASDAQDLTQEVFIKALQRSEQIKESGKAAHWLSRIATNTAIDFLRRHGRVGFSAIEDLLEPVAVSREESPEQRLLRAEHSGLLSRGLAQLSERERLALVLRDIEDLPAEEVARQMNCSKATVRSHIANARIKFRRFLERVQT
jgi:RNA polymerase sigma-70 factor (ECF subfamily)